MAAVVNLMTVAGFDQATLWVLHTNVRARLSTTPHSGDRTVRGGKK